MERLSVLLLFGVSLFLTVIACASSDGSKQELTQNDLRNQQAVTECLKSEINENRKASAKQFFLLGIKYRQRATKDGNWGPVAKAFGESAVLYPRPLALKEYAEASLKSQSKALLKKSLEEQMELLNQTIDLYRSVIAADSILCELSKDQRVELDQYLNCIEFYMQGGKPSIPCMPLQRLGLDK